MIKVSLQLLYAFEVSVLYLIITMMNAFAVEGLVSSSYNDL